MRCGGCDMNNISDWKAHAETKRHVEIIRNFEILEKITDGHIDYKKVLIPAMRKISSAELQKLFIQYLLNPTNETKTRIRTKVTKIAIPI